MAIAQMAKVMIVSHNSQVSDLLEALQAEGICQILNAEQAMVTKDMPELTAAAERPKDIESLLNRLQKCIASLKNYAPAKKGLAGAFSSRAVVDNQSYNKVIHQSDQILKIVEQFEQTEAEIERTKSEIENLSVTLEQLRPWASLQTPVEEIGPLRTTTCWAGLISQRQFGQVEEKIGELGGAIEVVGTTPNKYACLIASLNETADQVQKLLRSAEFEPVNFEPMTGNVEDLITQHTDKLNKAMQVLNELSEQAASLTENLLKLQILQDHYENLLNREQTKDTAPATEHTVILEAWVKKHNYKRLEKVVSQFDAASVTQIEPAEGEEIPVEIENKKIVKPFEVITRLYGMPQHFNVDPTVFLAPFFALFFALCLTDAGYGLVIIALMAFFIKKIKGDKKLMWMLGICSAVTVVVGALTGGWFGDAIQQFIPALNSVRAKIMWFDPLEEPMKFFVLAIIVGYIQIQVGLLIAFVHSLKQRDYAAAVCDKLTWLIVLNCVVLLIFGDRFGLSKQTSAILGKIALIPAVVILLFSQRQGSWVSRIGMGMYNLFSGIFYMGDVLSYLRLMALGMVTAGLAMAINIIAGIAYEIPYGIGILVMILVLVGGHSFNLAISGLGAFVHTLRLQYVEFFPKFLIGGGRLFQPLSKRYKNIYITTHEAK